MPRQKKSRKIGQIGTPKSLDKPLRSKTKEKTKEKQKKGNPSGSRHNVEVAGKTKSKTKKELIDPRHGSKKPVPLTVTKQSFETPKDELNAIESDNKLSSLLDKIDNNENLTKSQQVYVDEKLARHAQLCELLGIKEDEDEDDTDPLDHLDAISMEDFLDSDKK